MFITLAYFLSCKISQFIFYFLFNNMFNTKSVIVCLFSVIITQTQTLYIPGYGEIAHLNVTELLSGLPLPDDLKKTVIGCIFDEDSEQSASQRCDINIPLPYSFQALQKLIELVRKSKLISIPVKVVDKLADAVGDVKEAFIGPTSDIQKALSDAPVTIAKLLSPDTEADAEKLLDFAKTIKSSPPKPRANDPFQDLSGHLVRKSRVSEKDKEARKKNYDNLKFIFGNGDLKTIKKFGSNVNLLVPSNTIVAFIRSVIEL